jgi:signal transduction histidine kinase
MDTPSPIPMKKQVSALNTIWIIRYLSAHHAQVDIDDLLRALNDKKPYYIEDIRSGQLSMVRKEHLEDPHYWFSNPFMIALYRELEKRIPVPGLGYEIGKSCATSLPFHKVAILAPFLGPRGVVRRIVEESKKYNRTKKTVILENHLDYAKVRLIHQDGIIVNDFAMDWHAGVFFAYATVAGAKGVRVTWKACDPNLKTVDFDIRYRQPPLYKRFYYAWVFNMPPVRKALGQAEAIQLENREQLLSRDAVIEKRTCELKHAHNRLVEQERLLVEQHLAGGMAHEIRNALGAAKLRLNDLAASKSLESNIDALYDLFAEMNRIENIPDETKKKLVVIFRRLSDNHNLFGKACREVHRSIVRGLQITNRVMQYSTLHTSVGDTPVNLESTIRELIGNYSPSLERQNIRIVANIEENFKIRGSGGFLHSIVQNLILNARDAILEADRDSGNIRVSTYRNESAVVLEVEDNGIGIPEENKERIFQPFFSTKPATGMGLGLSECRKFITANGGRIEVESEIDRGSLFRISWPP